MFLKLPPVKLAKWVESEIRSRFQRELPLNLTAVKRQAPELIEALFDPKNFIGWRNALLACEIEPGKIVTELEQTVPCLLCEF